MKKDEFFELLTKNNINKKEFAKIADIPYSTVNNWGVSRKGRVLEIPNWVRQFLYYYNRANKLDYVAKEICEKLSEVREEYS